MGRWLNKDPIKLDGGWNLYGYVGNDPVNFMDQTGLEPISADEGQKIVDESRNWKGVEYVLGGKTKDGADCSGSTWSIYQNAGFGYKYSSTATFSGNPKFKPVPDNIPQVGDVGLYPGHVLIFDPNAGKGKNVWTAYQPGGKPYGASNTKYWESKGNVQWYRYDK